MARRRNLVFNATDGVYASPGEFPTRRAARAFVVRFRRRYRRQGYYRAVTGRMKPGQVRLIILEA